MTKQILIAESSPRDIQRFCALVEDVGLKYEVCCSGNETDKFLDKAPKGLAGIILLWEIQGPPFASELLLRSQHLFPDVPVVVVSSSLDATLATDAFKLGASDFLEKPLDLQRVRSCLNSLLFPPNSDSPLIEKLNEKILGKSSALISMLKQIAKVIEHRTSRVLLIGESGTGKELIAQSIYELSQYPKMPFVGVNVGAIPKELIESELFGHEKGAFTGASDIHRGFMEEAASGILFLDEIGELDISLQVKLLRVLQENKFRRIKGTREIKFDAQVICATNRDLTQAVKQGTFRQDLYHRINVVTIEIPSLRERENDIDLLLSHFLSVNGEKNKINFARETLSILKSYPFPGNIRELENFVTKSLVECEGNLILPKHLPLSTMGEFLITKDVSAKVDSKTFNQENNFNNLQSEPHDELFQELIKLLPQNWRDLPYKEALELYERAFDRVYLPNLFKVHQYNVTKATKTAGIDKKTFAQHWKNAELPSLRKEESDE